MNYIDLTNEEKATVDNMGNFFIQSGMNKKTFIMSLAFVLNKYKKIRR